MHTKFDSKSNRVKGVCFHSSRPWVLSSLHNGAIQLWDYQNKSLLHSFEEHDGPVRGIDFHFNQPLIASGGDDYKIKVWNYKQRRCLFTLLGHLDYIRTVKFHHDSPWIISASDDQTIRIWNWQSRTAISTLTGHNHYVMSASFHPKEDLVVSASLDNTVRVWDISPLKTKSSSASSMANVSNGSLETVVMSKVNQEIFGGTDVTVKYLLEGHERGVNWASFHPSLPLIVSGADDRQIKLWRMNDTKAWEVDTLRGHTNNVSSVLFHPKLDLIVSNGEDRSIRVWDISKRTCVATFKRDNDRFWILACDQRTGLLAAGHDTGMLVFSLRRDRPAFGVSQSNSKTTLVYVKDLKFLRTADILKDSVKESGEIALPSRNGKVAKYLLVNPYHSSKSDEPNVIVLSHPQSSNNSSTSIDVSERSEFGSSKSSYDLLSSTGSQNYHATALSAVFLSRNRILVLEQNHGLVVKNLTNDVSKRLNLTSVIDSTIDYIFCAGVSQESAGKVILRSEEKLFLFEANSRRVLAQTTVPSARQIFNALDGNIAVLGKQSVTLCDKMLGQLCSVLEPVRIKSGCFLNSSSGVSVFIYNTRTNIKYLLPNGDTGILYSTGDKIFLVTAERKASHMVAVTTLDKQSVVRMMDLDLTECDFKLALSKNQFAKVIKIIKESKKQKNSILGEGKNCKNLIRYLQQKGYPEVALHFVADIPTKFKLALSCSNLDVALECALQLNDFPSYSKLGEEAIWQGKFKIAEMCLQKTKNMEKLSFLYLLSGDSEKLTKMMKIAENRQDFVGRFVNSLYLNDSENTAKSLAVAHMPELSDMAGKVALDPVRISKATELEWPLLEVGRGVVHEALVKGVDLMEEEDLVDSKYPDYTGDDVESEKANDEFGNDFDEFDVEPKPLEVAKDEWGAAEEEDDLDFEELASPSSGLEHVDSFAEAAPEDPLQLDTKPGINFPDLWVSNSPLPVDHAAAGNFPSAKTLLDRQLGIKDFKLMEPLMQKAALSCKVFVPNPSVGALQTAQTSQVYLFRNPSAPTELLRPKTCFNLRMVRLQIEKCCIYFGRGQFSEALRGFRDALYMIPFVVVSATEEADLKGLLHQAKEYILGLLIEMERKKISKSEQVEMKVKSVEFSVYFANCDLKPSHLVLVLNIAMKSAYKIGNFITAAVLARQLLALREMNQETNADKKSLAQKILKKSEQSGRNEHQLGFDKSKEFTVCCQTLTPIYSDQSDAIKCPFCGAKAVSSSRGEMCNICRVATLGEETLGLLCSDSNH